jgi:excisionase family DNA binding protein
MDKLYYTIREVSELTNLPLKTIRSMYHSGKLRKVKRFAPIIRFSKETVERFIAQHLPK